MFNGFVCFLKVGMLRIWTDRPYISNSSPKYGMTIAKENLKNLHDKNHMKPSVDLAGFQRAEFSWGIFKLYARQHCSIYIIYDQEY